MGVMRGSGGGHNSDAHLTLCFCQGLSRETAKKLRFIPSVIYVDGRG